MILELQIDISLVISILVDLNKMRNSILSSNEF